MTRIVVKQLVWDDWNSDHIKKHQVSVEEVEVVARNLITHEAAKHGRYAVFGRVGMRILTLVIRREKPTVYYVVTARDAARKERKKVYEKEKIA